MEIIQGEAVLADPGFSKVMDYLTKHFKERPDAPAVRYRLTPDAETITVSYRQLEADLRAIQKVFGSLGLKGKRLAIVGDNSYVWMLSYLAQVCGMGLVIPLDRLLPQGELLDLLERGQVDALVYDLSFHRMLYRGRRPDTPVKYWIAARQERAAKAEQRAFAEDMENSQPGLYYFGSILAEGHRLVEEMGPDAWPDVDPDGDMSLLFTSGTSAAAKAVVLSQRTVTADIRAMMMMIDFRPNLKTLSILPLHHSFENTCGFQTTLALGGCVYVYDGLRYIAKNIKEYGPDLIVGVPTVFRMIQRKIQNGIEKSGKRKQFDFAKGLSRVLRKLGIDLRRKLFKSIRAELGGDLYIGITGAAPIEAETQRFFDDLGVALIQGYGMTECSPVVAGSNEHSNRFGTVGHPLPLVSLAIDNQKPGESGEVMIKGPMVMKGYYQDPEANAAAFNQDGWFMTGDIGYLEDGKYLVLNGRSKSMIVLSSGKKVFPEEIEESLRLATYVKEAMVFGREEAGADPIITCKIVLDKQELEDLLGPDCQPEKIQELLDGLLDRTNQKLPEFKKIRSYFYSFKDMVSTTTMKVKRNAELQEIQGLLASKGLTWSEITGQNIDQI